MLMLTMILMLSTLHQATTHLFCSDDETLYEVLVELRVHCTAHRVS